MKYLLIALATVSILADEMVVTREYTDFLKRHVDWEVVDYEDNIFRGWTLTEAKQLLGLLDSSNDDYYPSAEAKSDDVKENLPSSISWVGANCIHEVKDQGKCGSCWAFSTAGMLSDRCCLQGTDHGWLSAQELVSCVIRCKGCRGGWASWSLDYVKEVKGLVHEACFPYAATNSYCSNKCVDSKDWDSSHVCDCKGGYRFCNSIDKIKKCLQSGTVSVGFGVCKSFFSYKSGIYRCDCNGSYSGGHAVNVVGYSNTSSCYFTVRNSWGVLWGEKGYSNIACDTCGIFGSYPNANVICEAVG